MVDKRLLFSFVSSTPIDYAVTHEKGYVFKVYFAEVYCGRVCESQGVVSYVMARNDNCVLKIYSAVTVQVAKLHAEKGSVS